MGELRRRGVVESDDDDVCLDCLSESDVRGLFAVVPMAAPFEAGVKDFASSFTGNRAEQVATYGKEEEGEDTSNNIEQSEVPLEAGDMPAPASSKGDGGEFYEYGVDGFGKAWVSTSILSLMSFCLVVYFTAGCSNGAQVEEQGNDVSRWRRHG